MNRYVCYLKYFIIGFLMGKNNIYIVLVQEA